MCRISSHQRSQIRHASRRTRQTPSAPGATPGEPRACLHYLPLSGSARRADRVSGPRTGFRDRGLWVPGPRTAGRAGAADRRAGHGGGAGVCHSATGCMHAYSARATYDRTYVDRLRVIDRSIKKTSASRRPPHAATHTKQKESSSFPCGSCARICAWSASFFRTIVDLIFVLDDAEPPQSGSQPLSLYR